MNASMDVGEAAPAGRFLRHNAERDDVELPTFLHLDTNEPAPDELSIADSPRTRDLALRRLVTQVPRSTSSVNRKFELSMQEREPLLHARLTLLLSALPPHYPSTAGQWLSMA